MVVPTFVSSSPPSTQAELYRIRENIDVLESNMKSFTAKMQSKRDAICNQESKLLFGMPARQPPPAYPPPPTQTKSSCLPNWPNSETQTGQKKTLNLSPTVIYPPRSVTTEPSHPPPPPPTHTSPLRAPSVGVPCIYPIFCPSPPPTADPVFVPLRVIESQTQILSFVQSVCLPPPPLLMSSIVCAAQPSCLLQSPRH